MAGLRVHILRSKQANSGSDNLRTALILVFLALCLAIAGSVPNFLRNRISEFGMANMRALCHDYSGGTRNVTVFQLEHPTWWNCTWERANFWMTGILFKIIPCVLVSCNL